LKPSADWLGSLASVGAGRARFSGTAGKFGLSAALEDSALENMLGKTMNHLSGFRMRSGPMSSARSACVAV
jgi:hypothetical protein